MSVDPNQSRENAVRYRRMAELTTDPKLAQQLRDRADEYARQNRAERLQMADQESRIA